MTVREPQHHWRVRLAAGLASIWPRFAKPAVVFVLRVTSFLNPFSRRNPPEEQKKTARIHVDRPYMTRKTPAPYPVNPTPHPNPSGIKAPVPPETRDALLDAARLHYRNDMNQYLADLAQLTNGVPLDPDDQKNQPFLPDGPLLDKLMAMINDRMCPVEVVPRREFPAQFGYTDLEKIFLFKSTVQDPRIALQVLLREAVHYARQAKLSSRQSAKALEDETALDDISADRLVSDIKQADQEGRNSEERLAAAVAYLVARSVAAGPGPYPWLVQQAMHQGVSGQWVQEHQESLALWAYFVLGRFAIYQDDKGYYHPNNCQSLADLKNG